MKRYSTLFLLILLSFFIPKEVYAQCITSFTVTSIKDISCRDGNDGEITVELVGGTAPFRYILDIQNSEGDIFIGEVVNTTERVFTFNLANTQPFGIMAKSPIDGSTYSYRVRVISSDPNNVPGCATRSLSGITFSEPAAHLAVSIDAEDASCNGGNDGEATAIATGGTAPYTYEWNTTPVQTTQTATGLSVGTYTVTITDANGCITDNSVTIEQPTSLTLATSQTDVTCNGADNGEATVNVTGGTGPYIYSWNTTPVQTTQTAISLAPGTYTVIVTDDKGCSGTADITIAEPDPLVASISSNVDASCNGAADGETAVGVTGGTAPYAYNWNTSPVQTTATATGLTAGTYEVTVTDANGCTTTETVVVDEPMPVVAAIDNSKDASCNGANDGEATASASGGTAPYTFSWNITPTQNTATATGLAAGSYTVTVTDANGCSDVATVTIDEPTPIIIDISAVQDVTCNGGTDGEATAAASGGLAPYTYTWNTTPAQNAATATGLAAGTYTVTVEDANGCTETASVTIAEPDALSASAVSTDITCHGNGDGEIEVTVSGGTTNYEYSLDGTSFQSSNIFDNLAAGNYTITIRDANGCITTATATIDEPAALTASATADDATCNGDADGTITVTAGGGSPNYEYSLDGLNFQTSNLFENLVAGNYIITIKDANGCTTTASITIDDPVALTASASANDATCSSGSDGTITVTAGGGTPNYEYSLDGANFQTSNLFENLASGNYTITIRDANGCTVITTATVDAPDALTVSASATDVTCNGTADGTITVSAQDGTPGYEYSLDGTNFQAGNAFTGLAAGNYTVTVKDANGCTETATVTIDEPDALLASAVSTDITCHGGGDGQVEITVTGGTASYEYSLDGTTFQTSNLFDNLAAGNYTITIRDANGCFATATATVDEPAALTASIATVTDASCNGAADGEATVSVTGGTAPYAYSWNTSPVQTTATATGLAAGTYTVTITDANGCSTTENITIAAPSPVLIAIDNQTDVSCNGGNDGEATVSASGGTGPYTYSWNTAPVQTTATATGLAAGTYTVTVTDANGCSEAVNVTIAEPAILSVTATTLPDCDGDGTGSINLTVNGGTAPYTYTWSGGLPAQKDHNGTVAAGTYSVTVEDTNGCTVILNDIEVAPQIIADAGSDQTICFDTATLSASPVAADQTGVWIVLSGNGDFDNVNDPSTEVYNLSVGVNEFIWSVSDNAGNCAPSTDTVTIVVEDITIASAGPDQSVCENEATLSANAVKVGETGLWTVLEGTGNFSNNTDPSATVTGLMPGTNRFVWTIENGLCDPSADTVMIDFIEITIAEAGNDQTVCEDTATLQANAPKTGESGQWSVLEGTGTFSNNADPNTTVSGLTIGTNRFIWTISDLAGVCTPLTDTVTIVRNSISEADAGEDQIVCTDKTKLDAGAVAAGETGTWVRISGSGILANVNDPLSDVINLSEGDNLFAWVVADNVGVCSPTSDTVNIHYTILSIPNAGPDQTICTDETVLTAQPLKAGEIGEWSSFGNTATITDINSPTTTVTGLGVGTHIFIWSVSDVAGECGFRTDDVKVQVVGDLTKADAGADQEVCEEVTTLAANAVKIGESGQWTVLYGTGVLGNPTDPATTVKLSAGLNQFVWTITDNNGTCPASIDTVSINYIIVTKALAGPDQSICTDTTTLAANAVQLGELGTWTVLSGHGDFENGHDPETVVRNLNVGLNEFVWTISDAANICAATLDTVRIEVIGNLTEADAGPAQSVCIDETTLAANAVGAGEDGKWTVIYGTGNFADDTDPATEVRDLAIGLNQFVWTITDSNGTCPASSDTVSVNYIIVSQAIVGPDQSICTDTTTLAANAVQLGELGTWTVLSGHGDFENEHDPETVVRNLNVGLNEFVWTISDAANVCAATLDTVRIEVIGNLTEADAGPEQSVCVDETTLAANAAGPDETGTWTAIGSGTIDNVNDPNATVSGLTAGLNQFIWTITDNNGTCPASIDTVSINYIIVTKALAGPDQSICTDTTALAANTVQAGELGTWTVLSGHGDFENEHDPATVVRNLNVGLNEFVWTISDTANVCASTLDTVRIEVIGNLTKADAGTDLDVCIDEVTLAANAAGTDETGTWTAIGSGTIDNVNDPNANVTGLTAGLNQFIWTITDNGGTCPASADTVDVYYIVVTEALAGPDQSVCTDVVTLAANAVQAGEVGTWTVLSGNGDFQDVNDPETLVENLSVGINEFVWTISDAANVCASTLDTVRIEVIGNLTEADAGPEQSVCIDETTLAANAVGAGENGKWTVIHGTGNFADDTDPSTEVSGLAIGLNQFAWTITDNSGTCPASADTVDVYYTVVTEALAGPDQSVCTDVVTLAANAVQAGEVGTWTVLSGNGDFQDVNDPETLVENLSVGINEFVWTISDAANACASTLDTVRIEVIGNLTTADAGADQEVCIDETTLVANAVGADETGTWVLISGAGQIDNSNSSSTLVTGLSLGDNEFEWRITDNNSICPDSYDRVIITYDPQATPPTVAVTNYDYCIGEAITDFEAVGTDLKWYDDAALANEVGTGSPFMPTIDNTLAGTYTFYVTQTAAGCGESAAVEVTVNIDNTSPAPVVASPLVEVCQNTALPTLEATGTNLIWYTDAALTNQVGAGASYTPTATELDMAAIGTTVFYVTQNIGCGESPAVAVSVEVTNVSSLPVVVTPGAFCLNSPQPTLVATGTNLTWYADVALTNPIGAGPGFTPDATILDMSVAGTTIFYVTQDQGCGESAAVSVAVNVLEANDPACVGGGTGCGVFTQVFIDNVINPSCNSTGIISQDGEFLFNVMGGSAPYTFRIESAEGIEEQFNNPYFDGLKAGTYLATVKDALGNECSITYTLLVESNLVGVASNMVDAVCYGSNTGKATITITEGGTTGFYSYDNGASWFPFTSGNTVNNLPPDGTYNLLIGNQANDPCPGLVEVTINNQFEEIKVAGFNTVTPASCDNNDGEVQIGAITGGSGNYTFELNGAPYTMPDDFIIRSLARGEHRLSIIDDNNCRPTEPFKFHVDSPGLVLFVINSSPASCGNEDGWAEVEITDGAPPYYYSIGESSFQEVPGNKFILSGLAQGDYEVTIKSGNSTDACPNSQQLYIGGNSVVSYDMDITHIACYGDESGIISFTNISGGEINMEVNGPNGYERSVSNVGYNREFRNLEAGTYTVEFTQIGGCGAIRTETITIKQPRKLYAEIKEATISLPDIPTGSITVRVDQMSGTGPYVATAQRIYPTGDAFFYLQEDTVRMNSMNLQYELTFHDAPAGDYTVHLRDANGCDTTMTVLVDYDRRIFIPNVFTPNGDDANETFFVRNLPPEGAQMIITNRWGKVVYSNDSYDNTWDGEDLPDGIYYYKLILEEENFSGWVEIWRGSSR